MSISGSTNKSIPSGTQTNIGSVAVKSAGTYLLCTTVMISPAYEGRIRIVTSDYGIVEARGTGATAAPVNLVGIHTLSSSTNLNIALLLSAASTVTSFGTLIKIN